MKRAIIACALLLAGTFAAQAYHYNDTYRDLVRPNGKPRSDAIFNADLDACYRQTGQSRYADGDTPAFKQCMLGRKWRWQSVSIVRSPSSGSAPAFDSPTPSADPALVAPAPDAPSVPEPYMPSPSPDCPGSLC
jgi:hypothetical protein